MSTFDRDVERWVALRTAARWEKSLAAFLVGTGAKVYLPLMSRISVYGKKTREVQVPLFGGYVFCDENGYLAGSRASAEVRTKVAQMLRPQDEGRLRIELGAIADLLTDRKLVQERVAGRVGDRVRIVGGSLAGYGGKVVRVHPNRWVLIVEMSFLGARQEVEVDERMVERIEQPRGELT